MSDVRIPLGLSARDLASTIFRHKTAALLCYAALVAAVALYAFFWPPTYEARVRYLVKNDRIEPVLTAEQGGIRAMSKPGVTEADLNSEAEIMRSTAVLERTVQDNQLDRAPEHWALKALRWPMTTVARVYDAYHGQPAESAAAGAVRRLGRAIAVEPQRESSIIQVSLRWSDPRAAEAILSTHVKEYLAQHLAVHRVASAEEFYGAQANRIRTRLAEIDQQITAIRPGATSAQIEADRTLAAERASVFESEWRKALAERAVHRARIAGAEALRQPLADRVVVQDRTVISAEALQALKLRVLDLRLQQTDLLQKYEPTHRLVVDVAERLAQAEKLLTDEEQRSYSERTTGRNPLVDTLDQDLLTTRVELAALDARESATREQAEASQATVARLETQAAQLRDLQRDRRALEDKLLEFAKRADEAKVNNLMQFVNVAVIESVSAGAAPVSPRTGLLMALALTLGLLISLALPFGLDLADHRIRTDRELEAAAGVPVLATFDHYPAETLGTRHA